LDEHGKYIAKETQAVSMTRGELPGGTKGEWKLSGQQLLVWIVPHDA